MTWKPVCPLLRLGTWWMRYCLQGTQTSLRGMQLVPHSLIGERGGFPLWTLWNPPWTFHQTGAQATYLPWQEEWLGPFLPLHPVWGLRGVEALRGVGQAGELPRDLLVRGIGLAGLGITRKGQGPTTPQPPEHQEPYPREIFQEDMSMWAPRKGRGSGGSSRKWRLQQPQESPIRRWGLQSQLEICSIILPRGLSSLTREELLPGTFSTWDAGLTHRMESLRLRE